MKSKILILLLAQLSWFNGTYAQKIKTKGVEILTEVDRQSVISALKKEEKRWDEAFKLPKAHIPATANHYHSLLTDRELHPLREGMKYASQLLDAGLPEYRQRAFEVIARVLSRQDQDSASPTFGVWPYYDEEALNQMANPDYNWADFIGVYLIEDYINHADELPVHLKAAMKEATIRAASSIMKRDVKPSYTNIAIMGTFVTYVTGHLFGLPEMQAYADMRLKRFYDFTMNLNGFAEYNSPTYTVVALHELGRMKKYIIDREALRMTNACYRMAWQGLSTHFHAPTGQLAGPHSRSYSTLVRGNFYALLNEASNGKIKHKNVPKSLDAYKLPHAIPADLQGNFLTLNKPRIQIDTFGREPNAPMGYTYLHPKFCFGTVTRSYTWEQRRPFIAYWGTVEQPKYFRVRLMHDFVDFTTGQLFTDQKEGKAVSALCFATDGGDYHPSLDRIKGGSVIAKDLRVRFELADTSLYAKIKQSGRTFSVTDEGITLNVTMLEASFGDFLIRIKKDKDAQTAWVDWIIYSGAQRRLNLAALQRAVFAWATSLSESAESGTVAGKPTLTQEPAALTIRYDDLSVQVPVKPDTQQAIQAAARVE